MYIYTLASVSVCISLLLCVYVCSCILSMSNQKKPKSLQHILDFFLLLISFDLAIWLFCVYVCVCLCVCMCGYLFFFSFLLFHFICCEALFQITLGLMKKRFDYMYFAWFPIISKLFTAFRPCINFEQLLVERAQEITNNGNEEARE